MNKKFVGFALAATLAIPGAIAPTAAFAASEPTTGEVTIVQDGTITPTEAKAYIADINSTIETLKQAKANEPQADWSAEFNRLFATASELTQSLAVIANHGASLANADLTLARAHLIVEIGVTIDESVNNLQYKIEKTHVELGFAVTRAILRVSNIGATTAQLNDSITDLQNTYNRVSTYRDLLSTDRATIYVKSHLNKAIWNTRFERDKNILGKKDFWTYNALNKEITKAVGVWFRAKSTVADCDAAIAALNAAYAKAYAAPNAK